MSVSVSASPSPAGPPARRHVAQEIRVHDYLYDPAFVVSGARDFARTAFQAAMASAEVIVRPIYETMFCEIKTKPRYKVVYHPNCRLPEHMDRSYGASLRKAQYFDSRPVPELGGRDRYRFCAIPRAVLPIRTVSPVFHPPTPTLVEKLPPGPPVNRSMQTMYRESSAQTHPWQPDAKMADRCKETPEVLHLDKMEWGPGEYYRTGDLPADFHTTEIINKMRHARVWTELIEEGKLGRGMEKREAIIADVETRDWLFREAEIDELQNLRLELLEQEKSAERRGRVTRVQGKLRKLWCRKKEEMHKKISAIHRSRDRELRKLRALHESGGRAGLVERMRAARGGGAISQETCEPTSELRAPLARHGYQARRRHAEITYDPSVLAAADHAKLSAPPAWVESCGKDLTHTCSGHAKLRDTTQLCERETRWSEEFLTKLHMSLQQARLGATGLNAGPCRLLVSRKRNVVERPSTPEVDVVADDEERAHQAALTMQRIVRGRAVQMLMYEGRTRAAELTEELKTTHGLQREDKERIEKEQMIVRDKAAIEAQAEHKEETISGLVEELCGGAVSAALDFLEKELRKLRDERRSHAYMLIALRDKQMREAAEAGRRHYEERRRREHDQIFRQVIGVTQESVDAYLHDIIAEGAESCAEQEAAGHARLEADEMERAAREAGPMSSLQQSELIAELVHQLAIPEAQLQAARKKLRTTQDAGLGTVRAAIFDVVDRAEIRVGETCMKCGQLLGEKCTCGVCPITTEPAEKPEHRADPRWRYIRRQKRAPPLDIGVRYPPEHEFRCMLDAVVDDAVVSAREHRQDIAELVREAREDIEERIGVALECKDLVGTAVDVALEVRSKPPRRPEYRHTMYRHIEDAINRGEKENVCKCPHMLPSELRRRTELEALAALHGACVCEEQTEDTVSDEDSVDAQLLPSQLRELEERRRCKCDPRHVPSRAESLNILQVESGLELPDDVVYTPRPPAPSDQFDQE